MSLSLGAVFDRPLVGRGVVDVRYCLLTFGLMGTVGGACR
jgi:hypothetical protein